MKRGLCCVCAVLVCTALVFAGSPVRTGVDQKTGDAALTVTPAQPQTTVSSLGNVSPSELWSNRVPEGAAAHVWTRPAADSREVVYSCETGGLPPVAEGEPACGPGYVDNYNGGCNSTPAVFQPAEIWMEGTSGFYEAEPGTWSRDTDWYEVLCSEPTRITYTVYSEFYVQVLLIDGTAGCEASTVLAVSVADPCREAVIDFCVPGLADDPLTPTVEIGRYWLWVGPQFITDPSAMPCDSVRYCAHLEQATCEYPEPLACPSTAIPNVGQLPYGQLESWQLFVSNDRFPDYDPANGFLRYEHFTGVGATSGGINKVYWWGVGATYNDQGNLVACDLDPGTFTVTFWAHNKYTNRPFYVKEGWEWAYPPGAQCPLYSYTVTGADLTKEETGHVYEVRGSDGSLSAAYPLYRWSCELPEAMTLFEGWISIQNSDLCPFWWAASPGPMFGTGGVHVAENQGVDPVTRQDVDGDLSFCLGSTQSGPFTGACCDRSSDPAACRNTTADECVNPYDEWHPSVTCAAISCTPEYWACCTGTGASGCHIGFEYSAAECTGTWYRWYVCSPADPGYDADAWGGAGNVIVCPEQGAEAPITCDAAGMSFGRGLTGGYLYISWDRGTGDQRYVIDAFNHPSSGAVRRIHWWGNSTTVWDGPDCDFANPAPFAIRFYHTSGSGPAYNAPHKVYDPIYALYEETGYLWSGTEYGSIDRYSVTLPDPVTPGTGWQWISIASKTTNCDFIWAPGATGTSGFGQWFYNNGVCEATPGYRHRSFCLYTGVRTGACCNEITGTCLNGVQETTCASGGGTFYPSQRCDQIPAPGCYAHTGACCDRSTFPASCTMTTSADCTGQWLGADVSCDMCCYACPADGMPEGEPECYDGYVDTYNNGCFTQPTWEFDDFVNIFDGQVVCGKTGTYWVSQPDGSSSGRRDLDFYRYELSGTDPACTILQAKVRGEFEPDIWLMVGECFTDSWCGVEETYVMVYSRAAGGVCDYAIAAAPLPSDPPQYVYIMVSCFGSVGDVPCNTPYTLEIEKVAAGCCRIGEASGITSEAYCLALGGEWTAGDCCGEQECVLADSNCDGAVNVFDIDAFVLALTNPAQWLATYTCDICNNDCNCDGEVNVFDIDPFVQCLTSGGACTCP